MPRSSIPLGVPLIRTRTVKKALSIAIRYSHLRHQGLELEHAHEDCIHVIQLLTGASACLSGVRVARTMLIMMHCRGIRLLGG